MANLTTAEICAKVNDVDCDCYPTESQFRRWAVQLLCDISTGGGVADNVNISAFGGTAVTLGQKTMAASMPVVIASNQSAIPVTFSGTNDVNLLQVAGVATAAGAGASTTGTIRVIAASNSPEVTSLASIDTKTPALGQALAAASVPVVLTAAQITTLTPLATVAVTQSTSPWVVSGTVTTDTEFPAATVMADADANPTTTRVGANLLLYNGTTWDRVRGDTTNGIDVDVTRLSALVAGSAIIGKVGIDQTTPGTTNLVALAANQSVNVAQINGVTTQMGAGASGTGTQRVITATDSTIGTVTTLTGTTTLTPGTGAANLGKAEDSPAASGDTGVFILGVRRDAVTASAANGDYNELVVSQYGSVQTLPESQAKATYSATFGVATTTTHQDIAIIVGSGTKTVTVTRIEVTGIQTTSGIIQVYLDLRSTDNSGGTSTTPAKIPHDSTSAAATAVVRQYTANPTLGTSVGFIRRAHQAWTAAATAANISTTVWTFGEDQGKAIVLRGTSQCLAVNLNGVTVAGGGCVGTITWTEE